MSKTLAEKKVDGLVYYEINGKDYFPEVLVESLAKKNRQLSADITALREALALELSLIERIQRSRETGELPKDLIWETKQKSKQALAATDPNRVLEEI